MKMFWRQLEEVELAYEADRRRQLSHRLQAVPSSPLNKKASTLRGSFDYLVGTGEQRLRHGEAKRLRDLDI